MDEKLSGTFTTPAICGPRIRRTRPPIKDDDRNNF